MSGYDFSDEQKAHAPIAARDAFVKNLCADAGGGSHVCEMYDGHDEDRVRTYRNGHHCECGFGWGGEQ